MTVSQLPIEPAPAESSRRRRPRRGRLADLERLERRDLLSLGMVRDINPSGNSIPENTPSPSNDAPSEFLNVAGTLYFTATDGASGVELWKSDGTPSGTTMVKDINPGAAGSYPANLTDLDGRLVFTAYAPTYGWTLWASDGTAAGTIPLPSPTATPYQTANFQWSAAPETYTSTNPNGPLAVLNHRVYFSSGTDNPYIDGESYLDLWSSDGTPEGTRQITGDHGEPESITASGGTLFFSYGPFSSPGRELWGFNGSTPGLVKDIFPNGSSSYPSGLIDVGGTLYFWADDGVHGQEVWKSDGSVSGTALAKDVNPGGDSSVGNSGYQRASFGGHLLFSGVDGTTGTGFGEPYTSDGTASGTTVLANIGPGPGDSDPRAFTVVGGTLYFAANDGVHGYELWKSDGTPGGTALVTDGSPGAANGFVPSSRADLLPAGMGGVFYFEGRTEAGVGLWRSDGTVAGTYPLRNFGNPSSSGLVRNLTAVGGTLFFSVDDGVHGRELWAYRPLTAAIPAVAPDPHAGGVASLEIDFSEAVVGLDLSDLVLSRNGGPNLLTSAQTLTSPDGVRWILGDLSALTATPGTYTLRLADAGTGIHDNDGTPLIRGASETFTVISTSTLSIAGATVTEGDSGSSAANFTVTLSRAMPFDVAVSYATADGSAKAGADYLATTGTLTIPAGQTSAVIAVPVLGDTLNEADETFTVQLSNPINATLKTSRATGKIVDDDPLPSVSISDVAAAEGNAVSKSFVFVVTLSAPSGRAISVPYSTADGTATTAGADYTAKSGTLTIAAGATSGTIAITGKGDLNQEADETFFVNLGTPTNATVADGQAIGTILNDDFPTPSISIGDVSLAEGNSGTKTFTFTVSLSNPYGAAVSVMYATAPGTATATNDYTTKSGKVTIAAGATTATFSINVKGDAVFEPDETFFVNLSSPTNATIADAQGVGTIVNDDPGPLLLAAGAARPAGPVPPVTVAALKPIVDAAIGRWRRAGLGAAAVEALKRVTFQVADLAGDVLGLTSADRTVITIDRDAAGVGWFVDRTPGGDSEFVGGHARGAASGRVDLLSVVEHELGHALGLGHSEAGDDVMGDGLGVGVRRVSQPVDLGVLPNAPRATTAAVHDVAIVALGRGSIRRLRRRT